MKMKDLYLSYKLENDLNPRLFSHRVNLQHFLHGHLDDIMAEHPKFTHGGLLTNRMTGKALGFAYYDCIPTEFCRTRCYGLPMAGVYDYNMLRQGVLVSELLRQRNAEFLKGLVAASRACSHLKIGNWGDATIDQIPALLQLVKSCPETCFWWYTRKLDVATAANAEGCGNLRTYLSLDPCTSYPSPRNYPFGLTYVFGDGLRHPCHADILADDRLVAVFLLKKGRAIQDPNETSLMGHPRLCREKLMAARGQPKLQGVCLGCAGRCNYAPLFEIGTPKTTF